MTIHKITSINPFTFNFQIKKLHNEKYTNIILILKRQAQHFKATSHTNCDGIFSVIQKTYVDAVVTAK